MAPSQLREIPQMELTDTSGNDFHLADDTEGQVRLVYQLFTNCPDICGVQTGAARQRAGATRGARQRAGHRSDRRPRPGLAREYSVPTSTNSAQDFVGIVPQSEEQLTELQNALGSLASIKVFPTTTTEHR